MFWTTLMAAAQQWKSPVLAGCVLGGFFVTSQGGLCCSSTDERISSAQTFLNLFYIHAKQADTFSLMIAAWHDHSKQRALLQFLVTAWHMNNMPCKMQALKARLYWCTFFWPQSKHRTLGCYWTVSHGQVEVQHRSGSQQTEQPAWTLALIPF